VAGPEIRERDERSLAELTRQLSHDIAALVRSELALAKAEFATRAGRLAQGASLLAAAALFVVIAVACLVAAVIAALSLVVDVWLAALITALGALLLAAILGLVGMHAVRSASPPLPVDTLESAKEDLAWVRAQAKNGEK
jgi:uncharacterized membrane protein